MISHIYKCIYIHIPRTGGTFIEKLIDGENWWNNHSDEKHLLASQAKKLYSDYWDDYFKFSFVRDPWARSVSMLKYPEYFHVGLSSDRKLNIDGYKKTFGYPVCLEHDYRFAERKSVILTKHVTNSVYLNMLDEELDFIGKYENLQKDLEIVLNNIKLYKKFDVKPALYSYDSFYTEKIKEEVSDLYSVDIQKYQYSFGYGSLVGNY